MPETDDLLKWWRNQKETFPKLSLLANAIFAIFSLAYVNNHVIGTSLFRCGTHGCLQKCERNHNYLFMTVATTPIVEE